MSADNEFNEYLSRHGITRYELAKETGVGKTTILDICSGKAKVDRCTVGTIRKIANALNVDINTLIEMMDKIEG